MLGIIIIVPLIGCIFLISKPNFSNSKIFEIGLFFSIINFVFSLYTYFIFDNIEIQYQFQIEFISWSNLNFKSKIGIDGISIYFVLLTTFIIPICIITSIKNIKIICRKYVICFLIVESLLIATFVCQDLILFYVFFESVLVPLFLIVGIWGGSTSKVRASFLLFLYTLFGSLFILLSFTSILNNIGSTDILIISKNEISIEYQLVLFLGIFISIQVKTPLIPFHVWLPRAHAEAPLGGSVILAGLILKLATYGYMRIAIDIFPDACNYYSSHIQTIACITLVYASLCTLRQTDFKALVAYSSIGHIAVVCLGLFSNNIQGIEGAILLGIAHGVVSPALFILCGGVLYDRYHTRIFEYYRGITSYIPIFSLIFFLFTIFNSAVPLSANWAGEFLCLTGIFQENPIIASLASTGIVLSAAYSIWMYNRIAFGSMSRIIKHTQDLNRREFIVLFTLLWVAVILGIFPNICLDLLHINVTQLIYS